MAHSSQLITRFMAQSSTRGETITPPPNPCRGVRTAQKQASDLAVLMIRGRFHRMARTTPPTRDFLDLLRQDLLFLHSQVPADGEMVEGPGPAAHGDVEARDIAACGAAVASERGHGGPRYRRLTGLTFTPWSCTPLS